MDKWFPRRTASTITALLGLVTACKAWLPNHKIRGVNLGSLFVLEPWMAKDAWTQIGCHGQHSEFDCVSHLGQETANEKFEEHWKTWIQESDFDKMQSYGLNAVRIPVGYWMKEDLVYADSEHFPQGGIEYLDRVVGWASARNFFVVIDLHGAPGAQNAGNPSTGQFAPSPGFFQDFQYKRAYQFLEWMTERIHSNDNYTGVGIIEVLNEPVQDTSKTRTMISDYYPTANKTIRDAEDAAGVELGRRVHIQMMDKDWGSGDPSQNLKNQSQAAYDDHRYLKYANPPIEDDPAAYLQASCHDNRAAGNSEDTPLIVGEWSLSPPDKSQFDPQWDPSSNVEFYKKWWAAQVISYEKTEGWFFWSWKAQLGDYRWSYQDAVDAGAIPQNPDNAYSLGACN